MTEQSRDEMLALATKVRLNSACRFSHFAVGAAVRAASGKIYLGTNVESTSYGLTICAERAALCAAIAAGERELVEVVVIADCPEPVAPCGACRQLLHDYGAHAEVLLGNLSGQTQLTTVAALLPFAFTEAMLPTP